MSAKLSERPRSRASALAVLILSGACSGAIDGTLPAETGGGDSTKPSPSAPPSSMNPLPPVEMPMACQNPRPGPSPLRRLTRLEYANTVRDLLGLAENPAAAFAPDARALGFDNIAAAQSVSQLLAEQYEDGAVALATLAAQDLPKLLRCSPPMMGEETCARRFVTEFGLRAYRRPLTDAERDRLWTFYTAARAKYGFAPAIELILQAMLQSPNFLYRVELGLGPTAGANMAKLGAFELASRLSYLLWSSMPDDALLKAAAEGKLGTPTEIAAQAERLLADPRARSAVAHFHRQWLQLEELEHVSKDTTIYPLFKTTLRPLWKKETEVFLDEVIFKGDGRVETLFTADFTFANKTLAAFYGFTGPTSDATFDRVKLDGKRAGLLTQASLLAAHSHPDQSSPVHRGKFVRENLFCQDPPPPPNDIDIKPPEIKAGQSTRERFRIHNEVPSCAGCHKLLDSIGFAYENFDGIGLWRDVDQGQPVDASAELVGTDVDGKFVGALELSRRLARSEEVRSCVVKQWFRFAQGREETGEDECSLALLREHLKASNGNVRKLLLALTQTPAFLYRSVGGAP